MHRWESAQASRELSMRHVDEHWFQLKLEQSNQSKHSLLDFYQVSGSFCVRVFHPSISAILIIPFFCSIRISNSPGLHFGFNSTFENVWRHERLWAQAQERSIAHLMAPAVTFRPTHTCINYPVCSKAAQFLRSDGVRTWTNTCKKCACAVLCSHTGCPNHAAPNAERKGVKWSSHDRCAEHVADVAYTAEREWSLCSNRKTGCRQLSKKRGGGI